MRTPNLARAPFLNSRPVRRLSAVLWVLAAVLVLANLVLYAGYWKGSADARRELAATAEATAGEEKAIRDLEAELAGFDLEQQNEEVAFLNRLIDRRTFPWSPLFERLEEVLPRDVRLTSVQPSVDGRVAGPARSRSRGSTAGAPARRPIRRVDAGRAEDVALQLHGYARSSDALLELVDALYGHPSFRQPVLASESMQPSGELEFSLDVDYLTAEATAPVDAGSSPVAGDGEPEPTGDPAGAPPAGAPSAEPGAGPAAPTTGGPIAGGPDRLAGGPLPLDAAPPPGLGVAPPTASPGASASASPVRTDGGRLRAQPPSWRERAAASPPPPEPPVHWIPLNDLTAEQPPAVPAGPAPAPVAGERPRAPGPRAVPPGSRGPAGGPGGGGRPAPPSPGSPSPASPGNPDPVQPSASSTQRFGGGGAP